MSVTPEDVRHVAQLARLGVSDAQLPSLVAELNGILGHMQQLQQVNVSAGPPVSDGEPEAGMPLRDDRVGSVALHHARESFAPSMREGFFLVPRLDTHDAGVSTAEDAAGRAGSGVGGKEDGKGGSS